MFKIFLTGDAHIGIKYYKWRHGQQLEAARIDAFDGMVNTANEEGCGLFVIAGDLFESNTQCDKEDIVKVLDTLAKFNGVVAILPGNHDYYTMESPLWQQLTKLVSGMNNIVLLTAAREYPLTVGGKQVVIYPAPCLSLHSKENNLGWMKKLNIFSDDTYRIGIAHGTLVGQAMDTEGKYFPMTKEELENLPMDVWLLGHIHVPYPRNISVSNYTEGIRIFNAGTPVQTHHSCNTEGCAFIIEIDKKKQIRARRVVTGPVRFYALDLHLKGDDMEAELQRELQDVPDNSVVELTLSGAVSVDEYERRCEIIDSLLSRFIEAEYTDFSLTKLISQDLIDKTFSETSFSAQLLKALMSDPKEAQMAYDLLVSLKGGVRS